MAKRWYSVSVLSNYEKKIAETIRQSAIDSNMEEQIEEVFGSYGRDNRGAPW